MFDQILFAKIGWGDVYQGKDLTGRFRNDAWWERYNFLLRPDDRCYGYIPPITRYESPPKPQISDNWLVVFVAPENGSGATVPVGFYLGANFKPDYTPRPDGLTDCYGNQCDFCVSTEAANAYLIPVKKRSEFALQVRVTKHFTRNFAYARGNRVDENEDWRLILAETAERVVAVKRRFDRIG
jgi:hypothetical protein